EGWRVAALDLDPAGIGAAPESQARIEEFACDIRDRAGIGRAVADFAARNGPVGALIVSAGVLRPARLAEMSDEDYDLTFAVNTKGFLVCVQATLPHLQGEGASVIAISSASGQRPKAGNGAYAASKAALEFLARTLAMELAGRGSRFNCVAPGTIPT